MMVVPALLPRIKLNGSHILFLFIMADRLIGRKIFKKSGGFQNWNLEFARAREVVVVS